jgi:hypothetical protein
MPLVFWLNPAAVVEVLLDGCGISTSGILPMIEFSGHSTIVGGWFCLEVCVRSSSR